MLLLNINIDIFSYLCKYYPVIIGWIPRQSSIRTPALDQQNGASRNLRADA